MLRGCISLVTRRREKPHGTIRILGEDELRGLAVAVHCPVCNAPIVSGEPTGRFAVRCRRKKCGTIVEITSAFDGAPYSSGCATALTSEVGHVTQGDRASRGDPSH